MKCLYTLMLFLIAFVGHSQVNLDSLLVGYYPFSGGMMDESIYNNNALTDNSPELIDDCMGLAESAYYFDGEDDYLEISSIEEINFDNSTDFAISLKVKPSSIQFNDGGVVNDILVKWSNLSPDSYPYSIRVYNQANDNPGLVWVGRWDSNSAGCSNHTFIEGVNPIFDNSWHHIVFQKRDGVLELIVDSNLEGAIEDESNCDIENNLSLMLGRRSLNFTGDQSRSYQGGIDEVRLYRRSLSTEEIELLGDKETLSTMDNFVDEDVELYPNPIGSDRMIHFKNLEVDEVESLELLDIRGKLIETVNDFMVSDLVLPGMYFVRVHLKDSRAVFSKRIFLRE